MKRYPRGGINAFYPLMWMLLLSLARCDWHGFDPDCQTTCGLRSESADWTCAEVQVAENAAVKALGGVFGEGTVCQALYGVRLDARECAPVQQADHVPSWFDHGQQVAGLYYPDLNAVELCKAPFTKTSFPHELAHAVEHYTEDDVDHFGEHYLWKEKGIFDAIHAWQVAMTKEVL